jgi:hypothetical protein
MTAGHQLSSLIRQIVKNGAISIDTEHWLWLNQNFNPEEIKQLISLAVDEYEIPPPIKTLSIQDAKKSFVELQRFDALSLIETGRFFWRHHEYKLKPKSWTYIASRTSATPRRISFISGCGLRATTRSTCLLIKSGQTNSNV